MIKAAERILITISVLLAGERKMEPSTGLLEIHGEATGEREAILGLLEESIILVSRLLVHGLLQLIPGLRM